jgi:hypothetical protein
MTLTSFRLLAPRVQVTFALMRGTYLAHRWQEEDRLMLYHLPDGARGFFVEVGYDTLDARAVLRQSFTSTAPLEAYTLRIVLPQDLS